MIKSVSMIRWLPVPLALLLGLAAAGSAASAEEVSDAIGSRHALVIGNADYPDDDVPLTHPVKDARALADELRRSGFEVVLGENLTKQGLQTVVADFKAKITPGSAALLFFSGHGIQVARQNYIVPVNAQIWSEPDVRRDGIGIESVLADMDSRGAKVKIVIIDASRRNPFERRFRGFSAGLASINASQGTLIVYAAAPERIAADVTGENSLFVSEILKEMRTSGKTAEQVFMSAARGVARASEGRQVPWVSSSLADDFYFGGAKLAARLASDLTRVAPSAKPSVTSEKAAEPRRGCAEAELVSTRKGWSDLLASHPSGPCAELA